MPARAQQEAFINEINRFAHPIDTTLYRTKQFLPDSVFRNVSILALGESTHGTHEFFTTKNLVIRNLVLNNFAKVVAIEADFCRLLKLSTYLVDNTQSLDRLSSIYYNTGIYPIYYTKEIFDLLKWIKCYNLRKTSIAEKVQVFGLDMQTPYVIVRALIDSFPKLKTINEGVYNELIKLRDSYVSSTEEKLLAKSMSRYRDLADEVALLARQNISDGAIVYILQFTELMKQSLSLNEGFLRGSYASKRDEFLAKNVIWLKENFTKDREKLIVWAHNEHIAYGQIGGSYRMGHFLKRKYNNEYYALSFAFDGGYVRAYDPKLKKFSSFYYPPSEKKNSIEYTLKFARDSFFFLNLFQINNEKIDNFFDKNVYQKNVGQTYHKSLNKTYLKLPVIENFDGLIFIKNTTAAEPIK